jgi:oxygen-dependent protoporphyrinogen oxidase
VSRSLDADVIVVGGGISGLVCAWELQKSGHRVLLLEAAARPGGTIGTARDHGILLESGPNSTLDTTPLIGRLLDELGIARERIEASPAARNRYILRDGRLVPLPLSPAAFLATPLFSTHAKLRLLCEPFIRRGGSDIEESVAGFVRRRIGTEFLDYAINPFVAGVYAGDPGQLSVNAAFPKLHQLEQAHGSLILGQILGARERARNPEKSKQSAAMFAFRDGMQTLTDAIAQRLHHVELDAEVTGIEQRDGGHLVRTRGAAGPREYRARAVLLALPAYAAAGLVAPIAQEASAALSAISYPPVAVAVSAYRKNPAAHALDGFGFLVPQCEGREILGTIFSSTLFGNRAPPGLDVLTTFVGGTRQPALAQRDEPEIAELVQAENARILRMAPRADFIKVRRWPRAIPQYTLGHLARIAKIEAAEREVPGLYFCANYRGGVSIGDCIRAADTTAARVVAFLQAGSAAG